MPTNDKLVHGQPLVATSETGEPIAVGYVRPRFKIEFDLDLTDWGLGLIRNWRPPARLVREVIRALDPDYGNSLPPPANDAKLLAPPKGDDKT